jgi:hypothetical protein
MQTTIQLLYKTVSGNKKKERFETILEPLQALIQIALLSYYPIGSKLTIQNNILHIQAPSYTQSVTRWYNNDTQEDLFYLFNIFCRFKKFYTDIKVEHTKLFELLIHLAKNGINNLIRTYNQTDKTHVLHTLQMYKNMLDGTNNNYNYHTAAATPVSVSIIPELNHIVPPSLSQQQQQQQSSMNHEHSPYDKNNNKHNNKHGYHDKKNKITRVENDNVTASSISLESESERQLNKKELNSFPMSSPASQASPASPASPEIDMDTIFIKISELYTDEIFRIIYNVFIEMSRDDTNFVDYANGLNMMLHPINIRIKKWIDENIVF